MIAPEAPCEPLPWDSAFFGVGIARVRDTPAGLDRLEAAVARAEHEGVACLYLLVDDGDAVTRTAAESAGFELMERRVTLMRPIAAEDRQPRIDPAMRPARAADLPALEALARRSHHNTRFHRDPRFDRARADEMYAVWIARSVAGELADATWVLELEARALEARPLGYLAASFAGAVGAIGLVAVDASLRGKGYGRRLVEHAVQWTASRGGTRVEVVTPALDGDATGFYERSGFAVSRVQFWYHRWSVGRHA